MTRASRFLIGLVTCFATHDGIDEAHREGRLGEAAGLRRYPANRQSMIIFSVPPASPGLN